MNEETVFDAYQPQRYIKRPIVITAQRMHDAFTVVTLEGPMRGKPGDYLMTGIQGEQYVCDADIFHRTYMRESEYIAHDKKY